ncbi:MAG: NAD(P)-dependent oxidoreductase [Pseudomonadota bacterium]
MTELQSLPLFHRIERQRVLVLGDGEAAEPKSRLVRRAGGIVIDDVQQAVDEGVRIAFVAYDDPKACEAAAINLRCAGILVNVVDRPELCDFTTPSILDRNPVLIAIGTGGASAGLAKHVRLRLERLLPQTLGKLAEALFGIRSQLRQRFPDGGDRRRAIDAALSEGGTLDALDGGSHGQVGAWIDGATEAAPAQIVRFDIASADPEDLTIKQSRLLGEADAICVIGEVAPEVLARARADAVRLKCDQSNCPAASAAKSAETICHKAARQHAGARLTVILRYNSVG